MMDTSSLLITALCLTIRCMSEEFGKQREQLSKPQRLSQRVTGFSSSSSCWVDSRVGEPEKHSDQPVLQPGFHQNLHWNQHNSVENVNSEKIHSA